MSEAKSPRKAPAGKKVVPAASAKKKTTSSGKEIVPREKQSHKLTPAQVQMIIDLALNGYTVKATVEFFSDEYGMRIHDQTVLYHRMNSRKALLTAMDDEIARARAARPELATLTGRLEGLQEIIDKEKRKKRGSAYAMTQALATADSAMYHAEMLRLRLRESLAKYPERKEGESERVLRELERRSHIMRNVTEDVDRMTELAGEDFGDGAVIVTKAEVVEEGDSTEKPAEGAPAPEGIPEDVLTT